MISFLLILVYGGLLSWLWNPKNHHQLSTTFKVLQTIAGLIVVLLCLLMTNGA